MQKWVLEERRGIKKRVFMRIFRNLSRKENFLAVQGDLGIIIDVAGENYVFKTCKWEMSACKKRN